MSSYFTEIASRAAFSPARESKSDLFKGEQLFLGLNCFEPGQSQRIHAHESADKFYFLVSGKARMTVGADTRDVGEGTIVWAPAGVPHGVERAIERTIMLVAIAPPPPARPA